MVLRIPYTKAVVIITCIQNVNLSQRSRYLNIKVPSGTVVVTHLFVKK